MSYLGLPLGDNPKRLGFWSPVIERVGKRLEGWSRGCISKGGKLTLIQSVLESIPIYYLSIFKIPASVAKSMEKFMRDFLWEGFQGGKGEHLVGWDKVSRSKKAGGLGIGNLIKRNEALLGKWLWRFSEEQNAFWQSLIRSKYGVLETGWDSNVVTRGTYRNPWKAISAGLRKFVGNIRYKVGNGSKIRFWSDKWVGEVALQIKFPRIFRLAVHPEASVASNICWGSNDDFVWDIRLRRNLTVEEENEFVELLGLIGNCNVSRDGWDYRVWEGDKSGQFSTKSYFEVITRSSEAGNFEAHDMIWKNGVPSKVKVLAWLAVLKRVSTADLLQIRRPYLLLSPSWCVMCKRSGESLDHLLMHCSFVHYVWCNIRREFDLVSATPSSWHNLLVERWYFRGNKKKSKILWRSCCLAVLWCVWRERNSRIFEDKEESQEEIWLKVKSTASLWACSTSVFGRLYVSDLARDWKAALL